MKRPALLRSGPPAKPPVIPGLRLEGPLVPGGDGPPWVAVMTTSMERVVVRAARDQAGRPAVGSSAQLVLAQPMLDENQTAWAVAPHAAQGSLARWLIGRLLRPGEAITVGVAVARALAILHDAGWCYGPITTPNILLDAQCKAKLDATNTALRVATPRLVADDLAGLAEVLTASTEQPPSVLADLLRRVAHARPGEFSAAELVGALTAALPAHELGPVVSRSATLARPTGPKWRRALPAPGSRILPLGFAAAGALAVAVGLGMLWARLADPTPAVTPRPVSASNVRSSDQPVLPAGNRWEGIVLGLDQARVNAFQLADPAGLSAVDAPGSLALARDGEAVAALVNQGLRPAGQEFTVLRVQSAQTSGRRAVLTLTDRATGYQLLHTDGRLAATRPPRGPATWRVVLAWSGGRWLFADVAPVKSPASG